MVIHMTHDTLESIFGFHAAFGFLACAAMIALASALAWVLRRSDGEDGGQDD
jgi:predicted MFS family arabinose efflux permease